MRNLRLLVERELFRDPFKLYKILNFKSALVEHLTRTLTASS